MDHITLSVILGASVAGFVQGLSGFAFGLVAISFWAWTMDPKLAAVMTIFGAFTGQIITAITTRRTFNLKLIFPFLAGGVIGIPLGIAILPLLDIHLFKALLGLLLIIWCPAMLIIHTLPKIKIGGSITDGIVGVLGGIMGGIGGFSGTFPTLWCTLRGFSKDEQRALIQNFCLSMQSMTMAIYLAKGLITEQMLPMFAIIAAAILIPALLGSRLYTGISETTFRKIVLSLLTASGIALLSSSLPQLMVRLS